jgi:hypothetical protein
MPSARRLTFPLGARDAGAAAPRGPSATAAAPGASRAPAVRAMTPREPVGVAAISGAAGDSERVCCPVRLIELSQFGASVLGDGAPERGQHAWFRLTTPCPTDWIEVVVKEAAAITLGLHRIRLQFPESCPYDWFRIVILERSTSGRDEDPERPDAAHGP